MTAGSALVHSGNFHPIVVQVGDGHDRLDARAIGSCYRKVGLGWVGRGSKNEIRRRCRIGKAIRTATSAAGKHGNRNQCGFIAIARLANWMINSAARTSNAMASPSEWMLRQKGCFSPNAEKSAGARGETRTRTTEVGGF